MRLPRDISGQELAKKLKIFGYEIVRQVGSHIRLSTNQKGQHHITIPAHDTLRVGTLNAIITDVASHFAFTKEEVLTKLLG